jgi:glycosyltransferase involved in cell wall biosynthesis
MRIGIYVDSAREAQPTGIGLHVRNLVDALARIDESNEYLLYYPRGLWERAAFPHLPTQPNFQPRPVRFPPHWVWLYPRLWWNYWLPRAVHRDRLDVFHSPNHFLPAVGRAIVTIHDLAYFHKDDLYPPDMTAALRDWTRRALGRACRVIALSENTRRDIAALGVPPERIRVIYGGGHVVPDHVIRHDRRDELRRQFRLPERYVLFVGSLNPRKNVPFLLRGFARLKKEHGLPHGLVLVGHRDGAATEIDEVMDDLGITDDVTVTGYVEAWQLPLFYQMADLFVLPTLYEGFTLVTLEAMAYGVPVIATDTSSIREGVGDAAALVPVNDVARLAAEMYSLLTDGPRRQQLIDRGKVQARKFTWENCARQTLDLYREVGGGGGQ